jgi:hypothetical protein
MSEIAKTVLLAIVACLMLSTAAVAANRKAQRMVADMTKDQETLLEKYPPLVRIDSVIRSDCAARNEGKLATGAFCGCASALTMSVWSSGIDPNMLPRLNAYLRNPTEAGAATFLQYQGPELYRGLCTEANKR